jgi:capsule polysaccharide export protein KpsE/RkpR
VGGIALIVSLVIAFAIPKRYESVARIMPPETSGSGTEIFAALAGRALGGATLGGLAASLLGAHNTGALFTDLLQSGTVTGHLIDRFQLQAVYHKRYRIDTAKRLLRHTTITQDKKSGVITLMVTDANPTRARDLARAYLDELNVLVNRTSTSSAHQERVFIERRLDSVRVELERAQQALSDFSSTHATIDIKEQTRATVDAGAKLQAELIVTQGELDSLRQIYGNENVRVRAADARLANLKRELAKLGGTSAPLVADSNEASGSSPANLESLSYPPLRQLPRLAVPYANLYRTVRVQENVFELLTQQYEISRIQEAKDIPVVNVIDAPGIPEKKSFPPRTVVSLALTVIALVFTATCLVLTHHWQSVSVDDPRRALATEILQTLRNSKRRYVRFRRSSL